MILKYRSESYKIQRKTVSAVPGAWRSTNVISDKRNGCRGVSKIGTAYKIYIKFVYRRIQVLDEGLLLEEQTNFRKGRYYIGNVLL